MRLFLFAVASLAVSGAALAQDAGFTIQDDVSRENAVACVAARKALVPADMKARGSILLDLGTLSDAWERYVVAQPTYGDAAKVKADVAAETAKLSGESVETLRARVEPCKEFETKAPYR